MDVKKKNLSINLCEKKCKIGFKWKTKIQIKHIPTQDTTTVKNTEICAEYILLTKLNSRIEFQ